MRYADWDQRLLEFFDRMKNEPHAYGSNDCALFGANAVQAMTGNDLAAGIRGTYSTEMGAAKIITPYGGLFGFIDTKLPRDELAFCQRGDLVGIDGELGPFIAVAFGTVAISVHDHGTTHVPMTQALARWRVD